MWLPLDTSANLQSCFPTQIFQNFFLTLKSPTPIILRRWLQSYFPEKQKPSDIRSLILPVTNLYLPLFKPSCSLYYFHQHFYFCHLVINQGIITLQYCDGLWHTSTWIGHRHSCTCNLLNLLPASLPPHPTPLSCHRALVRSWPHTSNSHLLSSLHIQSVCFNAIPSSHPILSFPHCVEKSVLYVCVSFPALHIGSSVPSF